MSTERTAGEDPYGRCTWTASAGFRTWSRYGDIAMFGEDGQRATDLMLVSAAACLGFVLSEYVKNRALPVTDVQVSCTGTMARGPERVERITTRILVKGDISEAEREKMLTVCERACKVMNTFRNVPKIETVLVPPAEPAIT